MNDAPTPEGVIGDQEDADAETITSLDVSGFFADVDGDALTFSASGLPQGLSIDPATGVISGTIDPSASQAFAGGVHSVTITASDGNGGTVDQTFEWKVTNPSPTANDDAATTDEDTPVSGNVLTGAGANDAADTDPDGDTLSVVSFTIVGVPGVHDAGDTVTIPGAGVFTLAADGGYSFTPAANWNGVVPTVTYTISDGEGGSDEADLVITVNPVNDAPIISGGDQLATVVEAGNLDDGTPTAGTPGASGIFSATDIENDPLVWSVIGTPDATYGAFSIDSATGAWTYALDNSLAATQALKEGDSIPLTYRVQVSDGRGGIATREVVITINGANDAPVAVADVDVVTEAGVLDGGNDVTNGVATAEGNVLDNDSDVDAGETDTLQVSGVSFGASVGIVGSALTGTYGSLVLGADGAYVYTLDNEDADTQALGQGQTATDSFTYIVTDVNGATHTSTLTITVTGTNDRPVITSDTAAATGSVVEVGTNETGSDIASGQLTASDVDAEATQTWTIVDADGDFGTIVIDPATGAWTYTLDNSRAATQALNDGENGIDRFTAIVTDEHGAYREQIITINVAGSNDDLVGTTPAATVELPEDGTATGTLQDYVDDVDDIIEVTSFQIDADGDGTPETYTEGTYVWGTPIPLTDGDGIPRGTLSIELDGSYEFTPEPNYSGVVPTITYTMAETSGGGAEPVTQTITFEVTPVADTPELDGPKTVSVLEDTAQPLDLTKPVITDLGAGVANGDYPERLGAITLSVGGAGAAGVTFVTGATDLTPVGGVITIVLTDIDHVSNVPAEDVANGIYHLTSAQYEALQVVPPAESGDNFTVTVEVTSYEVDAGGAVVLDGEGDPVPGATNTQLITVDVQAVTDGATLTIAGASSASLTGSEDQPISIGGLAATLVDMDGNAGPDADGSERFEYVVTGLPAGTVVTIDGVETTISAAVASASSGERASAAPPVITIQPPANFSGDIEGVTITLNSRDTDTDSSGPITTETSSVTLNLYVAPVAGDVAASDVTTQEDTPVAFLAGVRVTDTDTDPDTLGGEVITSVAFTVPTGWVVTAPPVSAGWNYIINGDAAEIVFDASLTRAEREAILDDFTITPPAHSSLNATIALSITSVDSSSVNGSEVESAPAPVTRNVTITVEPVAERTDTDSDGLGGNDVTIMPDRTYAVAGAEDAWFALGTTYAGASNTTGGFNLLQGWSNADADEFVYAVLTPTLAPDTPGETEIGAQFRYSTDGGATWITQTYVGEPLWVPQQYLDTLQVKLPPDVSGTLTIGVQAGTVDYDDNAEVLMLPLDPPKVSGDGVSVDISGSATLSLIRFDPVADAVTMALNGRATGLEDSAIPLSIRTTSSDPSETFTVTISGIPLGATVTYGVGAGATSFTATPGDTSFEIPNFSNSVPVTITPPLHSNGDFPLTVSAVSVDGSAQSAPVSRTIDVSVTGVADVATVTLPATEYTVAEATLDGGNNRVSLADLVESVASPDADGSEAVTLRITGLPAEFSVFGATMVTMGTGGDRVWVVSADNLANVSIVTPPNYSGTVNFKVAPVTTENDGDSRTGNLVDISFAVTPSPEATITTGATLVEDEVTSLNMGIVLQNGDEDEALGRIFISQDYASGADYTLFLGSVALDAAGLNTIVFGGVTYFVIEAEQVADLGAQGASDLDGDLGSLDFLYEVVDPSSDGSLPAVTEIKPGALALSATPVTDPVDVSINDITMTSAAGSVADNNAGDDAAPDTATVTAEGALTVRMHVDSQDSDGSEHLVRILITGVPDGVTVTGASQIGADSWLLIYEAGDARSIGGGGIDVPVEFIVGIGAGNGLSTISMTAQVQDQGQSPTTPASVVTDSVVWTLDVALTDGGVFLPPVIEQWEYNGAAGTEDAAFVLGGVMDAAVSVGDPDLAYSYTVTVTDLPPGAQVSGMILTNVGGVPTWTATVTVPAGGDSQAALDSLLASISITPPPDSNDNNASFAFDARLMGSVVGGPSIEADERADMPVTPVTDEAVIAVTAFDVDESENSVNATIVVSDPADGADGQVVDGKLYVQVSTANNDGGTVTDGVGATVPLSTVSGVAGVPDGDYYVIDVGTAGGSVDLIYTAPDGVTLQPGAVTFTAYAQTQETGAANVASATAAGSAVIEIVNNGVTVSNQAVTGAEPASADKSQAIELTGLSVALNDGDGSESIQSILLAGVPVGFLLYVGDSAGDATLAAQASNAGGDGVTNTWVLSADGSMPAYVAILPAPYWSGTLDNLALVVESGEASLEETRVDTVPLETLTVEAVANGVVFDPTLSFGAEGRIISLNLNASMADAAAANAAVADGSIETTTLQITGLGQYAAFYVGDTLYDAFTYDPLTDTYVITGLSQDDLDDLGFVQAASALTDMDTDTPGVQVTVNAFTVESGNDAQTAPLPVPKTLTIALSSAQGTTGDDRFIWDGEAINGRAGVDTVALRLGENLSRSDLATYLRNVEALDLSAPGANRITGGLSISDVLSITGSSSGRLTIHGDDDDDVSLSNTDEWSTDGQAQDGYIIYTSTSSGVSVAIDEDVNVSYAA
ncbi:VCBS domain-containing protein [Brevundimonas diminuta]|uniref:VCBS domain-containing protein n=1 Tax=Brevundimonas diminuta TaxID=293 RepID=UPI00320B0301